MRQSTVQLIEQHCPTCRTPMPTYTVQGFIDGWLWLRCRHCNTDVRVSDWTENMATENQPLPEGVMG